MGVKRSDTLVDACLPKRELLSFKIYPQIAKIATSILLLLLLSLVYGLKMMSGKMKFIHKSF